MGRRSAALGLLVAAVLGSGTLSPQVPAQDPGKPASRTDPSRRKERERVLAAESEGDFGIWKQKAQLELEFLKAQVDAKNAEILMRQAEHRAKQLAPDLAILTKLEEPVTMSFPNETPLEDVLKYMKSATQGPNDSGIPIYVDPEGLNKAEKTMQSPVVLDLEGVPLRTTLRLVLKQPGLFYTVKDGLLTITSPPFP